MREGSAAIRNHCKPEPAARVLEETTEGHFVRQKRWCGYFRISRKLFRTRANSLQDFNTRWLISATNFRAIPFPREKRWIRFFASARMKAFKIGMGLNGTMICLNAPSAR